MTPTATPDVPLRPAFRDGQVLRAGDLRDETGAVAAAARRHQEFAHSPGVVAGLWLDATGVTPGMAVDGAGRAILLASSAPHDNPPALPADVWIAYADDERGPNRVADGYELLYEPPGRYDPARPADHPVNAVFLGTLRTDSVCNDGRVYAGAVGARVVAASGRARLLLGPEVPGDVRLFAAGTLDAATGEFRDHLAVESTGATRLVGRVTVAARTPTGLAVVTAGHRPLGATGRLRDGPLGVGFVGLRPLPSTALPASVSLVAADKTGTRRELRFEIANPGKDNNPEWYKVAVGTVSTADAGASAFTPVLTADASGAVTVRGDLKVYTGFPPGTGNAGVGLIVQVTKPASPDDTPGKAGPSGRFSPFDLAILGATVKRLDGGLELTDIHVRNTGEVAITDVQVHAAVYRTDQTVGVSLESTPLVRNVVIRAKQNAPLVDPEDESKPRFLAIGQPALSKLGVPVTLVLSVSGHGPGFVPVSSQRTFFIK